MMYPIKSNEWPGQGSATLADGIFYDKSCGLWYVVSHGITYSGFASYEEAEKWAME